MLLSAAGRALDSAKAEPRGHWWDCLGTILYCSLSVEAIGNTYGEAFITRWQDFESASPPAKIRLVAERCGLQANFSDTPWSIVPELIRFRNRIAHAKPENISVEAVHSQEDYEKYLYQRPASKLEKMVTLSFAQRSYDSVYEILGLFATGLPVDALIELETEHWHGGAEPARPSA